MSTPGPQVCGVAAHPMAYPQQNMYPMDQNPTTSHPQWQYGHQVAPGAHNVYHPQQHQMSQADRPQYPRPPSRSVGPNSQTAHWMNQHYMNNENWAYSASPVPSIAPSVISQSQYLDDRMSMLSVNTAMTGHGQGEPESQRCFSSNGSTCENINPDMAFAQLMRDVDYVMHNWFSIRDPIKRCEMSIKLLMWIKNKGLYHLDENMSSRYVQQLVAIIADGLALWTPPDQPPPQEYIALACRILEVLHKLILFKPAIPVLASVFSTTEGERSLKELLCPFIPLNQNPQLNRCSYIVVDFLVKVLQVKNMDGMKIAFLKSLKFPKMVHMLIKHLHEAPICDVNVLIVLRNIISRDTNIKEYLIRFHHPKEDPLPNLSLIRVVLDCVIPRSINSPQSAPLLNDLNISPIYSAIISHTCHLLRTLLHDAKTINDFVRLQGINNICNLLQRLNDVRVAKDAFNLFLHVSDSPAFQEVNTPLAFILHVMSYYQDDDIFKLGTGFLSNIVANKPRFKKEAIQNNAINLLVTIISKFPRIQEVVEEKRRQLICEVLSNSFRTLINLLPFLVQNSQEIFENEMKQHEILSSVNKLVSSDSLLKYMNFLTCDISAREIGNIVELRSYILRFLIIIVKIPFISKNGFLDVIDEARKENIIGHVLNCYTWSIPLYLEPVDRVEKDQREKLVERAITLILLVMENCNVSDTVANQCRYLMNCPLELIRESQNEGFMRLVLDFCDKITEKCADISLTWNIDRPMVEGLTNSRNASIARAANSLLSRMTVASSEPLADVFANTDFY